MPAIEELTEFAHRLADASGDVIRPWFRAPRMDVIDKKTGRAGYDPVTEADRAAELVQRGMIRERYPTHGILGEEHGHHPPESPKSSSEQTFTWLLDPIDGTRAFICGLAQWGTLIALNDGTRPILGVLDQPVTRERWVGVSDRAELWTVASDGGEKKVEAIRTRACEDVKSAILMTTHPTAYFDEVERPLFQRVEAATRMTRFGGDCYMYGLLAMGFIDLIVEAQLNAWDVQALIPIIRGAGGVITSWDGGDPQNGGRILAAGDARVHAEAMALLK